MQTIIQTPTSRLEDSLDFYSKLDFEVLADADSVYVSDGQVVIEINPDRFARAGIKLYQRQWKTEVGKLEKLTTISEIENGFLLSDPSGVWIYLKETRGDIESDLGNVHPSALGNFAGISLETTAIARSVDLWQILGFSKQMGAPEQGWVNLVNEEGIAVSLMKPHSCPHLFYNPSLTYFNGKDNLSVIQNIRDLDIPITEEITHFNEEGIVDNIILRDPGGLGFFVFSD